MTKPLTIPVTKHTNHRRLSYTDLTYAFDTQTLQQNTYKYVLSSIYFRFLILLKASLRSK